MDIQCSGNTDKALSILEEYTELVMGDIYPLKLKGDDYFNLIDEFDLGTNLPQDEKSVRKNMVDVAVNNPTFATLTYERCFVMIVEKLKNKLLGGAV